MHQNKLCLASRRTRTLPFIGELGGTIEELAEDNSVGAPEDGVLTPVDGREDVGESIEAVLEEELRPSRSTDSGLVLVRLQGERLGFEM